MKEAMVLTSEGTKIKAVNESEGELIKANNEAEAEKVRRVKTAEGEALSITLRAEAQASAIASVAEALEKENGEQAAQLEVANEYIKMYAEMSGTSNTMIFSEQPGNVNALLAQATAAVKAAGGLPALGGVGDTSS